MRILSFLTLFIPCLLLPVAADHNPRFLSRHKASSPQRLPSLLTSRQYHAPRSLIDVCINVNLDLLAHAAQLLGLQGILGPLDLGTDIQLCLCLKDLELYLQTDDQIQSVIGLLGIGTVRTLITALINTSPESQQCSFPAHAHHTCTTSDPCHFDCDDHYIRDGDTCVCAPGYIECNGVCDVFPQGCSSALPKLKARDVEPITTLSQAQAFCGPHKTVCGIPGREGSLAFECLDVSSTRDSCGGCLTPHPFLEAEPVHRTSGQDCFAIPNAHKVGCSAGRCTVQSCNQGWIPSTANDICVLEQSLYPKIRRVSKRSDPLVADTDSAVDISGDLVTQLLAITAGVLNLDQYLPAPSGPKSSSDPSSLSSLYSSLNDVYAATASLLSSQTVGALVTYTYDLLYASTQLDSLLGTCGCVDALGLDGLVKETDVLVTELLALQGWYDHNPVVAPSTAAPGSPSPQPPSNHPDQPIIIGLTDLLAILGLKGSGKSGIVIDGLLGDGLDATINDLDDAVLIGPHNYRREEGSDYSHSIVAPSALPGPDNSTPTPGDGPIIVGLTSLLSGLGLGPIKSVTTVDGLTDPGLTSYTNDLLDDLSLGPHNARRAVASSPSTIQSDTDVTLNSDLTKSLAKYVVDLQGSLNAISTSGTASCLAGTDTLLKELVVATSALVKSSTLSALTANTNALIHADYGLQQALSVCGTSKALQDTYQYLLLISKVALEVQSDSYAHSGPSHPAPQPAPPHPQPVQPVQPAPPHPAHPTPPSPHCSDEIILSLNDLYKAVGLGDIKTVVDTCGLGLGLSSTYNGLLNSLDIGPNNVRRELDERQVTPGDGSTIEIDNQFQTRIYALIDLVLGLNNVKDTLPAGPSSPIRPPSTGPLPDIDTDLVKDIVNATAKVLTATTDTQLIRGIDALVAASVFALNRLNSCGCVETFGLEAVYNYVSRITPLSLDLQKRCRPHHPVDGGHRQPTTSSKPLVAGLSTLLEGLGLGEGGDNGVVVDGLLGDELDEYLNGLLDGLALGPSDYRGSRRE